LSNIDTFGLDETSVAKGHDYITLLNRSCIFNRPFECVVECYFNGVTHSGFERTNIHGGYHQPFSQIPSTGSH
jgi:hypothetical protein